MRFNPETGEFENIGQSNTSPSNPNHQPQNLRSNNHSTPTQTDKGVGGWGVLYFLFPLIGIIMYFVYKANKKPNSASGAIWCAIAAIIFIFIMNIIEHSTKR